MLFNVLKLLGLDVRAEIAAVKGEIEQRVDEVTVRARRAALTAAVIVALSTFAGLFCTMAMGVGLIELYRAEAATYGVDVALAVVAAILVAAALVLIGVAWTMGRSLSAAPRRDPPRDVAAAAAAPVPPSMATTPPAAAAGGITEPLAFLLALLTAKPGLGHPALDELVAKLRTPAGGKADEAVGQALNLVRNGDRTQLAVMLGAAALAGWLLARSRPDPAPRDPAPPR
jgi:Flp pilus assembly protein protease CpaA